MKAFLCLSAVLAAANAAPQFLGGHLGHAVHGPVVAAGYHARPAGQVTHQSVSKPYQGEHRSTTQSKAFGAGVAAVADSPNRLHGARGVVAHPVAHAVAHPIAHGFGHGVAHAVAHPVAVAHAPVVHHAPVVAHHAVGGYAQPDLAEPSPYSYTYAVADDYSGAAFNQAESNDGTGVVDGSYSVNLPDGRIQHVKYHANDYDGYVADVTYEGTATYANTVAHPVAHAVAHPAVVAHPVAHAVAHPAVVARPIAHAVAHPVAHAVAHPAVLGHGVALGHGVGIGHGLAHIG